MKKVYITSSPHEKAMQRALVQYRKPENYDLVKEALLKCGRNDLIGFDKNCLIPPRKIGGNGKNKNSNKESLNNKKVKKDNIVKSVNKKKPNKTNNNSSHKKKRRY